MYKRPQTPAALLSSAYRRLTIRSGKSFRSQASSLQFLNFHPPIPAVSAVRPSSLRRLRSASPTADLSKSPIKRKTDDCTPLQSSASLISSAPHRHQTCRAERTSPLSRLQHQSGIGRASPSLQHGFRQRLHPRFRSVPSPPMPSYLGPGRLAALSAAAYSVPQSSLTPIPLRYIPVRPGSTTLALLRVPQDSRTVLRAQRCSLRSPVDKEFTRLPRRPGAQSLQMSISTTAKSRQSAIPCRHPILPAPLRSSRQTGGIYVT